MVSVSLFPFLPLVARNSAFLSVRPARTHLRNVQETRSFVSIAMYLAEISMRNKRTRIVATFTLFAAFAFASRTFGKRRILRDSRFDAPAVRGTLEIREWGKRGKSKSDKLTLCGLIIRGERNVGRICGRKGKERSVEGR